MKWNQNRNEVSMCVCLCSCLLVKLVKLDASYLDRYYCYYYHCFNVVGVSSDGETKNAICLRQNGNSATLHMNLIWFHSTETNGNSTGCVSCFDNRNVYLPTPVCDRTRYTNRMINNYTNLCARFVVSFMLLHINFASRRQIR